MKFIICNNYDTAVFVNILLCRCYIINSDGLYKVV